VVSERIRRHRTRARADRTGGDRYNRARERPADGGALSARRAAVCVLTGAGVSADSGLATFRGGGGLWEGRSVEDVATPEAWARDPATVWRFYQMRRSALGAVEPNAAHVALAELERRLEAAGVGFMLITQNVDDLHERAGSRHARHMHGELARLTCEACGQRLVDRTSLDPDAFVPCPACAHPRLRPDVVWFGEVPHHLPAIDAAVRAATHFLALGTSGVVYPAAGLLEAARTFGARTWVASLDAPQNLHPRDAFVPGRAAEVVPGLLERLADELAG
jgi:NAD-dependent deacetylase